MTNKSTLIQFPTNVQNVHKKIEMLALSTHLMISPNFAVNTESFWRPNAIGKYLNSSDRI